MLVIKKRKENTPFQSTEKQIRKLIFKFKHMKFDNFGYFYNPLKSFYILLNGKSFKFDLSIPRTLEFESFKIL